jgi:hypothetical protein
MKKILLAAVLTAWCFTLQAAMGFTGLDPEVNAWMGRVRTNSGNYTTLSLVANDTAMKMAKAAGLRSKLIRFSLFDGDRTGSLNPLIKDVGAVTDNAFPTMGYSESLGWNCAGGATEYLSTGVNPTNLTANDAHLAIYFGGTAGAHGWIPMGVTGFGADHFFLLASYTAVGAGGPIWATPYPSAADTSGLGFYLVTRTSSSADGTKVYKDGSLVATSASVGGSPPNTGADAAGVMILNCNNAGSALGGAPSTKYAHGYHLGKGFTAADASAMNNIWLRAKAILGR